MFKVSFLRLQVPFGPVLLFCLLPLQPGNGWTGANADRLVDQILEMSGKWKGVCSVIGIEDTDLAHSLARTGDFYVHLLDTDRDRVEQAMEEIDEGGLYGRSIVADSIGSWRNLPYADNVIDLILKTRLRKEDLSELFLREILRVLVPGGMAILGCRNEAGEGGNPPVGEKTLEQWLKKLDPAEVEIFTNEFGVWGQIVKPFPPGVDDWSFWQHSVDNNPVSEDQVIRAPYMTQFLAKPFYITMPAVTTAAGGRIFIAMGHIAHHVREEPWLNTLLARNGYNGTELWRRKLPDGYMVHRSAFIATDKVFFMIDPSGSGVLLLDPETGEEVERIKLRRHRGDWKWIAMKDGVLYALIGKEKDPAETTVVRSKLPHWSWGELSRGYYARRVPWGFGEKILAYDLATKEVLWVHTEAKPIDSRAMVMGPRRIYLYGPELGVVCLNQRNGQRVWSNEDPKVRGLIEEPGMGLSSTPGFRSHCFSIYTPKAVIYEAQTRMNVVALSTEDGRLLWYKPKTTNNPNMIYLDGKLLVGIGEEGNTLVVDPVSGEIVEDLGFRKRSCARLTATPDSLFVRGMPEGLTRFDRRTKKVLFNGAFRPACNDGVIGANGMLYLGPWTCDCNLALMGRVALCSAGDFPFRFPVEAADRIERGREDFDDVKPFEITPEDWPTYRGDNSRSASTPVRVSDTVSRVWGYSPETPNNPTVPVIAGGLVFVGGDDGKVRAVDLTSGLLKWVYRTGGPILQPPTVWEGRAFVGSGDGFIYVLEAATGELLWRFRAAPVERRIMVYGALCSTWPVNSGILIDDGVAYAAAGVIDFDGTYVYALDAKTGEVKWCNDTSGHLDPQLRKGVSAQGNLTVADGKLWMAGGNVVSPAVYDLATGEYLGEGPGDGSPRSNRGEEIGVISGRFIIHGGRLRYSAARNVINPGQFESCTVDIDSPTAPKLKIHSGKIPPAWDEELFVFVKGVGRAPRCWKMEDLKDYLDKGGDPPTNVWEASALEGSDTVSIALTSNRVLAVCETPRERQLATSWFLTALDREDGNVVWQARLPGPAVPGALAVGPDGRAVVALEKGDLVCLGGDVTIKKLIESLETAAMTDPDKEKEAVKYLLASLDELRSPSARQMVIQALEKVGITIDKELREEGYLTRWNLLGPVPWDMAGGSDEPLIGEPDVDLNRTCEVGGRSLKWRTFTTSKDYGRVDLDMLFGERAGLAVYAYTEVVLEEDKDLVLMIGSNDGFVCWFNGEEVGHFNGGRGYVPNQDSVSVHGKKGVNRILLKVTQYGNKWEFSVRVMDAGEKPVNLARSD